MARRWQRRARRRACAPTRRRRRPTRVPRRGAGRTARVRPFRVGTGSTLDAEIGRAASPIAGQDDVLARWTLVESGRAKSTTAHACTACARQLGWFLTHDRPLPRCVRAQTTRMSSLKDFKVLAALGKGSYGSVMKVERLKDTCPYAVKEVNIRRLSPRERCVWGRHQRRGRAPTSGLAAAGFAAASTRSDVAPAWLSPAIPLQRGCPQRDPHPGLHQAPQHRPVSSGAGVHK